MDAPLDLTTASREVLLELITQLRSTLTEQEAIIAQLQRRTAELEARLNTRGSPGMPGNKSSSRPRPPRKEGRKRREHSFTRMRMAPTQRVEHAVEVCPDCGTVLSGGWVQRTREVIEVPVVPVQITEHVLVARVCPACQQRRVPQADLQGVVVGQSA